MKKFIALGVMVLALSACGVDPQKGKSAVESMGYTNVNVGGFTFWGCDEKDSFRSSFTATGVDGKPVSGVLCSGWLKGTTVRLN